MLAYDPLAMDGGRATFPMGAHWHGLYKGRSVSVLEAEGPLRSPLRRRSEGTTTITDYPFDFDETRFLVQYGDGTTEWAPYKSLTDLTTVT